MAVRNVPEVELKVWLAGFAAELAQRCQQQEIFLFIQPLWVLESVPRMVTGTPAKAHRLN